MHAALIPINKFARHHWALFNYAIVRIKDHNGVLNPDHMRTDSAMHRDAFAMISPPQQLEGGRYPTITRDRKQVVHHDDWDCLQELVAEGLLEYQPQPDFICLLCDQDSGLCQRTVALTSKGKLVELALQEHINKGGKIHNFYVERVTKTKAILGA